MSKQPSNKSPLSLPLSLLESIKYIESRSESRSEDDGSKLSPMSKQQNYDELQQTLNRNPLGLPETIKHIESRSEYDDSELVPMTEPEKEKKATDSTTTQKMMETNFEMEESFRNKPEPQNTILTGHTFKSLSPNHNTKQQSK